MTTVVALAMGAATGILSGLMGVGGGVILVPMLVFVFGMSQQMAQGISLLVIIPTAIAGIWRLRHDNFINVRTASLIAIGAVLGAMASANFVQAVPSDALRKVFGVVLALTGIRMVLAQRSFKASLYRKPIPDEWLKNE